MISSLEWPSCLLNVKERMTGRYQQMRQEFDQPIRPYAKYRWIGLVIIILFVLACIAAYIFHANRCVRPPDRGIPPVIGRLNCSADAIAKSAKIPNNVDHVRPADIAYIAALGDSITSGTLAYDRPDEFSCLTWDHPGNSFAMGGDGTLDTHLTLPNILRHLNPALLGFSRGVGKDVQNTVLNVAYPGKWSDDMPRQARELVERFKKYPKNSVQSDWKLISVFIGTNDITGMCKNDNATSKEAYKSYLIEAITIIQANLPRSIISLIGMWNLNHQWRAAKIIYNTTYNCTTANFEERAQKRIVEYREALNELAADASLQSNDQAVVVQRVFDDLNTPLKRADGTYDTHFYATDTFHLSKYGSSLVAKQLWSQLLQPVGSKQTTNDDMADTDAYLVCPDEACPYIRTIGNSKNCVKINENEE